MARCDFYVGAVDRRIGFSGRSLLVHECVCAGADFASTCGDAVQSRPCDCDHAKLGFMHDAVIR